MASSSGDDVRVAPGPGAEVQQPATIEACDGSSPETTTAKVSATTTVLLPRDQQQHDTAPEPDHNHEDAAAAPEQVPEVSASSQHPGEENPPPVAKEEWPEHKQQVPADEDDDHHQEGARERLRQHRQAVAGRVWVPEMWGQENRLKDWLDHAVFDRPLVPAGLLTARRALVAESCTRRPD